MKNTIIISAVVGAVVGVVFGYFAFSSAEAPVTAINTSTSATFNSAKLAATGFAPATASASSSASLYNSDASDRIIEDAFAFCSDVGTSQTYLTGAGLASLTFAIGTSSLSSQSDPNVNSFLLTIATSTGNVYVASSTEPAVAGAAGRVWASGTYLIINANATNTADCISGVHYLAS